MNMPGICQNFCVTVCNINCFHFKIPFCVALKAGNFSESKNAGKAEFYRAWGLKSKLRIRMS